MPSNVLLGLIIDIADQLQDNSTSYWADTYRALLPRLVLKMALHHKFHSTDGQLASIGNSLYWNYAFTRNGRSSEYHHRNNFSEFNKSSYDQFLINFNKVISAERFHKSKVSLNIEQLLKQLSDLIMVRFDWDISFLTSPVIVNKSTKSRLHVSSTKNVEKYHYLYYLSLSVTSSTPTITRNPKSASLTTIHNYIKRNAIQFTWLPFLFDIRGESKQSQFFPKILANFKIQFFPLVPFIMRFNSLDDSNNQPSRSFESVYFLLAYIETQHSHRPDTTIKSSQHYSNTKINSSNNSLTLDAFLLKELLNEIGSTNYLNCWMNVSMADVPNIQRFRDSLHSPRINDNRFNSVDSNKKKTKNVAIDDNNLFEKPTTLRNTTSTTNEELSDIVVSCTAEIAPKNLLDTKETDNLLDKEFEKCINHFHTLIESADNDVIIENSSDLEKILLITINDFNEKVRQESKSIIIRLFCHQILYRLLIFQQFPSSKHLIKELVGLLRKYALLISPVQMNHFLSNRIVPYFCENLRDSLITIFDELMLSKPPQLYDHCLKDSTSLSNPYGSSTSTPILLDKFETTQLASNLLDEKENSRAVIHNDDSHSQHTYKFFQTRKNLSINDSRRRRRLIAVKDSTSTVRRLLFNKYPDPTFTAQPSQNYQSLLDENEVDKNDKNYSLPHDVKGSYEQQNDGDMESFFSDLEYTQYGFGHNTSMIPHRNLQERSRPKIFYSSKSFSQATSLTHPYEKTSKPKSHHKVQSFNVAPNVAEDDLTHSIFNLENIFATPQKIDFAKSVIGCEQSNQNSPSSTASTCAFSYGDDDARVDSRASSVLNDNQSLSIATPPNQTLVDGNSVLVSTVVATDQSITQSPFLKQYYNFPNTSNNATESQPLFSPFKYSCYTNSNGFSTPNNSSNKHANPPFSPLIKSPFKSPIQFSRKYPPISPKKYPLPQNQFSSKNSLMESSHSACTSYPSDEVDYNVKKSSRNEHQEP